jgi:hypothetical protein
MAERGTKSQCQAKPVLQRKPIGPWVAVGCNCPEGKSSKPDSELVIEAIKSGREFLAAQMITAAPKKERETEAVSGTTAIHESVGCINATLLKLLLARGDDPGSVSKKYSKYSKYSELL